MQTIRTADDARELGTVLGVWAHPDDEAYLSGALMALARRAGNRVVCATATRGEQGSPDPAVWPPARLAVAPRARAAGLAGRARRGRAPLARSRRRRLRRRLHRPRRRRHRRALALGAARHRRHLRPRRHDRPSRPPGALALDDSGLGGHRPSGPAAAGHDHRPVRPGARRDLHDRFGVFLEPALPVRTPEVDLAVSIEPPEEVLDQKLAALRAQASQTSGLIGSRPSARPATAPGSPAAPSPTAHRSSGAIATGTSGPSWS